MLTKQYRELLHRLSPHIDSQRMLHDDMSILAFGTDASFYRLLPKLVIKANTEKEVQLILKECADLNLPATFRSAGTSLSGQTLSDSVLIMLDHGWKEMEILQEGEQIRLQTGVVGAAANQKLLPLQKKIGPDPASINAAMIGGIVANNAGGMGCGTVEDSYGTVAGMRIIFPDGTLLDTLNPGSIKQFKTSHKTLINGIQTLRDRIANDSKLSEKIRHKYRIKNTTGYTLKAFIDFEDPIDIIQHLMVGSEGTLAFLSEVTLNTVHEFSNKAAALIIFPNIEQACKAVALLKQTPADAVELMDRAALRSVENKPGMPDYLKSLNDGATALLVEARHDDAAVLSDQVTAIQKAIENIQQVIPAQFTWNAEEQTALWSVRKGLFPSVSADRPVGTTVIIEDVAFDIHRLAEATRDLQGLFEKHGYQDAIIFGHALEGNFHFVFTQDFNKTEELDRYQNFIDDLTQMVVKKYDGSLKAEHGTGRNMAPFVSLEWGDEAWFLMKEIKALFDPKNIINPGVLINDDPKLHLKNLKPLPQAHPLIDNCIECGFCEVHCVANNLTLSPRQRIVVYREIQRLIRSGHEQQRLSQLRDKFAYYGNETCATDGLCALGCPVDIETGALIKQLRCETASSFSMKIAGTLAGNMDKLTAMMRVGLNIVHGVHLILGSRLLGSITRAFHLISGKRIPLWNAAMPKGGKRIRVTSSTGRPQVVYFPSCITRGMGTSKGDVDARNLTEVTAELIEKAGYNIVWPDGMDNLCCGMAFASKGFKTAGDAKASELNQALLTASQNGRLPVLCDMSPCLYRMKETLDRKLNLYEPIEFTLEFLIDKLHIEKQKQTVAIHPVCSAKKMGLEQKMMDLASLCAEKVVMSDVNCCGFAGDRGFSFPELNAHGLRNLRSQIPEDCSKGYSTSRTCEIGLTLHSGISYQSILYLVDACSKAKK